MPRDRLACIDIGSNTTTLLVAEAADGRLRKVMQQRAFTRIGKSIKRGQISEDKLTEVVKTVAEQIRLARELGAGSIEIVATAAVRDAGNGADFAAELSASCGLGVRILSEGEEARFAFVGATNALRHPVNGTIAVIDVGGGSTEIVTGTVADGVTWSESFRIGSGFLTDAYVKSSPPSIGELNSMRQHAFGVFEGLVVPPAETAVAVGGSATSLRRVVGNVLEYETLERALRIVATTSASEVALQFGVEDERVKLMPAGTVILEAVLKLVGVPLRIGKGGIREGVILSSHQTAIPSSTGNL